VPRPAASCALLLLLFAIADAPGAAEPALSETLGLRQSEDTRRVEAPVYQHLRLIAPAAPGGGWDQTARVMQQVLQSAGIVHTSSVENISGAAGTIGLARFVTAERGAGDVAMMSGLIMLGAIVTHRSALTLHDVTPIARLLGEYEVIVVPAASPFRSLADLIRAFKERPESISWGGGSAGGTEQILAGLIADAVGVNPRRVNYIAFSGGGELRPSVLGGQVSVGLDGLAGFQPYIDAGTVRVLAISSATRLPDLDAPTLREQGIDVELENWRCIVAPPGVSGADRQRLEGAVKAMVASTAWHEVLERYRWNDRYLGAEEFARFLDSEEARVLAILKKLGTGGDNAPTGPYPVLVLAGLAIFTLVATAGLVRGRSRAADAPATPAGVLAVAWKKIALIAIGIAVDLLLVERGGFVIASTALFWATARAFDSRHPARDALFAVAVSIGAYLLFARALQLPLPAGVLAGWM
jgi:putative tricarboxylic transport membrane protein